MPLQQSAEFESLNYCIAELPEPPIFDISGSGFGQISAPVPTPTPAGT